MTELLNYKQLLRFSNFLYKIINLNIRPIKVNWYLCW